MALILMTMPEGGMTSPGRVWVADTEAERPSSNLMAGDRCFCKDTGKEYVATGATTWTNSFAGGGGPGGETSWGQITGALSNQSDLNTALSGKSATSHNHDATYAPILHAHANHPVILRKTADQSSSLNTFVDVSGLTFAVAASTDYAFDFVVVYRTVATTTGIRLAVNGPLLPTNLCYRVQTQRVNAALSAAGAVDNVTCFVAQTYDGAVADTGVAAANTDYIGRVTGVLRNGVNAGTLALRFASEVATSAVTIRQGSWGLYF